MKNVIAIPIILSGKPHQIDESDRMGPDWGRLTDAEREYLFPIFAILCRFKKSPPDAPLYDPNNGHRLADPAIPFTLLPMKSGREAAFLLRKVIFNRQSPLRIDSTAEEQLRKLDIILSQKIALTPNSFYYGEEQRIADHLKREVPSHLFYHTMKIVTLTQHKEGVCKILEAQFTKYARNMYYIEPPQENVPGQTTLILQFPVMSVNKADLISNGLLNSLHAAGYPVIGNAEINRFLLKSTKSARDARLSGAPCPV